MNTPWKASFLIAVALAGHSAAWSQGFDFKDQLFGDPQTIGIFIQALNASTGEIQLNGWDTRAPSTPFTFDWGDDSITSGFFPQDHTYADVAENYLIEVTAHYDDGGSGTAATIARFIPPSVSPIPLPPELAVTFPGDPVILTNVRFPSYGAPDNLFPFGDETFSTTPRSVAEYVLSVGASVQYDLVNQNAQLIGGTFNQVVLHIPGFAGAFSVWFTEPVAVALGEFGGTFPWSSLFHEMGHNVTLNTPSEYIYGGKVDGNANAIYSETLAQVFQHATVYEILNHVADYGISPDLAFDIEQSAILSISFIRSAYDRYVDAGMPFASWNDPGTPQDETFDTFMTVARTFLAYAENLETGYRMPTRRMMGFLQKVVDDELHQLYDQHVNSLAADTVRATLFAAAVSRAFLMDLRDDFKSLNFPVDDNFFDDLMEKGGRVAREIRTLLEGPYVAPDDSMAVRLLDVLPASHPYSGQPWNYIGGEAVSPEDILPANGIPDFYDDNPTIVDWILVVLLAGDPSLPPLDTVATRAGFITSDGWIVDTSGVDPLTFDGVTLDSSRVAVIHRNHLAVMSAPAIDMLGRSGTWDFSSDMARAYAAGSDPMKTLPGGAVVLFAGDGEADGFVQALDFNLYLAETVAGVEGYVPGDYNMDGSTQALDFNLYIANTIAGAASQVP